MNKCSNCGNEVEGKFCTKCGTEFVPPAQSFCKMCGTQLKEGAAFCHKCGYNPTTGAQPTPAPQPTPQPKPAQPPKPEARLDPPQEKELSKFQMILKAARIPIIVGIIGIAVAVVLLIVYISTRQLGWIIGTVISGLVGVIFTGAAFIVAKTTSRAICPECKKFMGNSGSAVNYEFVCTHEKKNFDNNGRLLNYTYIYTCTIECPYCGSTSMFDYTVHAAKSESEADVLVNKYIRDMLNIKI